MKMRKGFTLIEVIIAMVVMIVLTTVTFVEFRAGKGENDLAVAGDQALGNVLALQQRAGSNIVECANGVANYGIEIDLDAGTYVLFADCNEDALYTPANDIEINHEEAEILVSNVKISDFYDGNQRVQTGKQTIAFQGMTRDVFVNGLQMSHDRASFIVSLNNNEQCARIDVWASSKSVERNVSPSCDASKYETD